MSEQRLIAGQNTELAAGPVLGDAQVTPLPAATSHDEVAAAAYGPYEERLKALGAGKRDGRRRQR